ncbi:MAG TPA: response regulator, partial [Ferruginibacter sp.]|nr:response regulator [Ferruginibacter sp.]
VDMGAMIKLMLSFKGYAVTLIEDAEEVEVAVLNQSFDLIFLDMLLSGKNGVDICRGLKNDTAVQHIPIIMMSAHTDAKNICMEAGANDFIAKPFEMHDIFLKITDILKSD